MSQGFKDVEYMRPYITRLKGKVFPSLEKGHFLLNKGQIPKQRHT